MLCLLTTIGTVSSDLKKNYYLLFCKNAITSSVSNESQITTDRRYRLNTTSMAAIFVSRDGDARTTSTTHDVKFE